MQLVLAASANAIGLGNLRVYSALGQPLKAELDLLGSEISEIRQSCIHAKVETAEGSALVSAHATLLESKTSVSILLQTKQNLLEPAVKIVVNLNCDTKLHREFLILLDPPQFLSEQAKKSVLARISDGSTSSQEPLSERRFEPAKGIYQESNPEAPLSAQKPVTSKFSKKSIAVKPANNTEDGKLNFQGLRLSTVLTLQDPQRIKLNMDQLRKAQSQFAALLRGEEVFVVSSQEQQAHSSIENKQSWQKDLALLKKQHQLDLEKIKQISESYFSPNWIIGLSGLLLCGLVMMSVLLLSLRRLKRAQAGWWLQGKSEKLPEPSMSVEDIVNNVQASYQQSDLQSTSAADISASKTTASELQSDKTSGSGLNINSQFNTDHFFKPALSDTKALEASNSSVYNFFATRGNTVSVEEISDVTQEAEFWMSVNDPQRAIEILEPQAEVEHPESPVPWLYLLDLYKAVQIKQKYDALREKFILYFNANIPEFEAQTEALEVRHLEDFTHLTERICQLWGSSEIIPFLQSLLVDDRDGARMGFDLPVYRDILLLISIAHELERIASIEGASSNLWLTDHASPPQKALEAEPESMDFVIDLLIPSGKTK